MTKTDFKNTYEAFMHWLFGFDKSSSQSGLPIV